MRFAMSRNKGFDRVSAYNAPLNDRCVCVCLYLSVYLPISLSLSLSLLGAVDVVVSKKGA